VTVDTTATQSADGSVGGLTSSEARELSAVLLEAADEVDRWTQSHGTVQR
jgi:hypothetical protein